MAGRTSCCTTRQARNLSLGTFVYTSGTWPANLTIVAGTTSSGGGQAPAPAPVPLATVGPDTPAIGGPAESSPDGAAPAFLDKAMVVSDDAPLSPLPPPVDVTLTLDLAGAGNGTVTSNPAGLATCSGSAQTCLGTFESGTFVTLTATAASGHEFLGWSGACSGIGTCTLTLTSARYVAAQFRLVVPPVVTHYYHLDALGSVRAMTNTDGTTARRDDYLAFGEGGTPPMGDSIRFTGKERDAETALDYFSARYYRNLMGRFTTPDDPDFMDPFNPQSMNRYAYVLNNPMRWVDPTGHQVECPAGSSYCETVNVTAKAVSDAAYASWRFLLTTTQRARGAIKSAFDQANERIRSDWSACKMDAFGAQCNELAVGINDTAAMAAGMAVGGLRPTSGQVGQMQRVLAQQGKRGVEKALRSLEARLVEHQAKIEAAKHLGGHVSSMEREVRNFQQLIEAAKQVLKK